MPNSSCNDKRDVSFPLTYADNNKGCNSIEDAQVPHAKDHMVQEKSHQAA